MATATNRHSNPETQGGQREEWTIHESECLAGLALLEDRSVDVVFSDPPYEAECHTSRQIRRSAAGEGHVLTTSMSSSASAASKARNSWRARRLGR